MSLPLIEELFKVRFPATLLTAKTDLDCNSKQANETLKKAANQQLVRKVRGVYLPEDKAVDLWKDLGLL